MTNVLLQTGLQAVAGPAKALPHVEALWAQILVLAAVYAATMLLSGRLVRHFTKRSAAKPQPVGGGTAPSGGAMNAYDAGALIGKCENILTLTLLLLDRPDGLAIIFAAKSLVRQDEIKANPGYYLGGTLVNLVWGLGMGILARFLVLGH